MTHDHVTHINESCQTRQWVMSHTLMNHVTHMNESCHTNQWVMSYHGRSKSGITLRHTVTHCNTLQNTATYCNTLQHTATHWKMPYKRDVLQCVAVWRSGIVWKSPVASGTSSCHKYRCIVAHINESCHTYQWVMSHISTSHVTHMNESCHTYQRVMSHGWLASGTS